MPIDNLDTFDPRDFDANALGLGHAAGAQLPGGAGRSLVERIAVLHAKVDEIIDDGVNGLPLTSTVLTDPDEKTIAAGVITVTKNIHSVDTQADAASDDLDTINGMEDWGIVFLYPANGARTVVVKHNTGNIITPGGADVTMADATDLLLAVYNPTAAKVVVLPVSTLVAGNSGLGALLASTAASKGASLVGIQDAAAVITATTVETALLEIVNRLGTRPIADPGNAGAISVTNSGYCPLVSAGAETRTLAAPSFVGQRIVISMKTDGGDIVVTCATTFNEAGNNTATFDNTGETLILTAVEEGATLRWRGTVADGAALTTV